MTCIIGMLDRKNECVWIGGDSLGSNGYCKSTYSQPKVFRNKMFENLIIGSTGTFRHIDLLKYSDKLFDELDKYKEKQFDHEYMVTKFIPNAVELFKNGIIDKTGSDKGTNFIVGIKDKLFEIQSDYSVLEPSLGFCSVGSGEDVAMGSLFTTKDMDMYIPDKIKLALEAAESCSCGVQRPFCIINTKNNTVIEVK